MVRRNDRKNKRLACGTCLYDASQDVVVRCRYGTCLKVYCADHGFANGFMSTVHGCPCGIDRWLNFRDMVPQRPAAVKPSLHGRRHRRR